MDEELSYLAGFFDGEGHIAIGTNRSTGGKRRWYLRFACHQVNPLPLKLMKARWGGSIQRTERHGNQRTIYEWVATSRMAEQAIRDLLPYLRIKRAEAELALEFQGILRIGSRHALTQEEEKARETIYLKMRALKHLRYD
jgi:hypothetical protein